MIERHGRNGTYVSEAARSTPQEVILGLETAAESLVIVARQLGADEEATLTALRGAWRRL